MTGRRLRAAALASFVAACVLAVPAARAGSVVQARVELSVRWGRGAGSEAFRDDLERAVAASLAAGCFSSVAARETVPGAQEADLVLAVVLSDAVEEVRFEDSIAGALEPGDPAKELRRVADCSVTVEASLSARATGAVVASKHFTIKVSRRPLYVGEDSQASARSQAADSAVRALSKGLGCGGAKLDRKVREALSRQGPPEPRSR